MGFRGGPVPPFLPLNPLFPTLQEEGVVLIPRRVLLRLEKGIEVPKGAFHKVLRRHLREPGGTKRIKGGVPPTLRGVIDGGAPQNSPHFQEDLPQLGANLQQRMEVPSGRRQPQRCEVVGFEGELPPGTPVGGAQQRFGAPR